jgi:hypothetical protein
MGQTEFLPIIQGDLVEIFRKMSRTDEDIHKPPQAYFILGAVSKLQRKCI